MENICVPLQHNITPVGFTDGYLIILNGRRDAMRREKREENSQNAMEHVCVCVCVSMQWSFEGMTILAMFS